jgi:hypothetical protein
VLEQLRAETPPEHQPSRVQIWPEHFDIAVELGDESTDQRAAYGLSPGDDVRDEPYLYVAPWSPPDAAPLWNARTFRGADLPLSELLDAPDQRAAALEFLRERARALSRAPSA